ncbi:GmrSD restriction endonuclease domain-containing protein [Dapis sp. BLCC M172]
MVNSDKFNLRDCLEDIKNGNIQLPDFQRDWKWDDETIRRLLGSVSLSYPIGSVLLLETGSPDVKFKARLIEGVEVSKEVIPEKLILDGQQRLTALYQALMSNQPVSTTTGHKKKSIKVRYYLQIEDALKSDYRRDDAIVGVTEDRQKKYLDVLAPEKQYEDRLYPLTKIFDPFDWEQGYCKYWEERDSDQIKLYKEFRQKVIDNSFGKFVIPYIELPKKTPKPAISQIFLRVNQSNEKLKTFDLLTAQFATDNFSLREDWKKRQKELTNDGKEKHVFNKIDESAFLTAVTLLATESQNNPKCRDTDILDLKLEDYKKWSNEIQDSLKEIEKFLYEEKVFTEQEVPYTSQIMSMAIACIKIGLDDWKIAGTKNKISKWFWSGIFSGNYGSGITLEKVLIADLQVPKWILGRENKMPERAGNSSFYKSRLLKLKNRSSAQFKGLSALLMRDGCRDFLTGSSIDSQKYFDEDIDMHHIFPQAWCKKHNLDPNKYNSVVNKTQLSAETNRKIGGKSPSEYLKVIMKEGKMGKNQMEEILRSHNIEPSHLWNDDFDKFFAHRKEALIQKIEKAMGKKVIDDLDDPMPF